LEGEPSDRDQAAVHGVGGEPEPIQRVCSEEGQTTRISEHDERGQCLPVPACHRHGHVAGDDAAIGGHELTAELWRDPQVVKDIGRDPGVAGAGIYLKVYQSPSRT